MTLSVPLVSGHKPHDAIAKSCDAVEHCRWLSPIMLGAAKEATHAMLPQAFDLCDR